MGETVSGPINGDVTDYEFVDEEMLIATVEKDGVTYKETYKFVEAERV